MKRLRYGRLWGVAAVVVAALAWSWLVRVPPLEGQNHRLRSPQAPTGAVVGPEPYPSGEADLVPPPRTFPLEQILQYKALPAYAESPLLEQKVADGTLPPVAERLPREPQVMMTAAMSTGPGEYGGVWRDVYAAPTEGWNWGGGQSQGYYGVDSILQQSLVRSGPIYLRSDRPEPLPNLARGWEWSDDGRTLTMHLIRGARWSDGHPFTAEDVMFTWEDLMLDPKVRNRASRSSWQLDGQDVHLERVDAFTLCWSFPVAFPVQLLFRMDEMDFSIAPAHILKPQHPRYNRDTDYMRFENCLPPQKLPPVVLGPWVPVYYKTDELMVMRRNPYYWKVDEKGQQLPYLDEVVFERANTGIQRTYRTLAGAADHTNLENPNSFVEVTKRLGNPATHFDVVWGPETLGFSLQINQSANLGVKTDRDRELRCLFRDRRFRRALSQALDRRGLCSVLVRGPFLRPWPGGLFPGSPYFDLDSVVYYPFSPPGSRRLLADLGFEDTDGNGILNWTRGALAGEELVVALFTDETPANLTLAEAVLALLADVGIKINLRRMEATGRRAAVESGAWELTVTRNAQEFAVPFTRAEELAPLTRQTPVWHREGNQPRVLQPFEREMMGIVERFRTEPDVARRKALMSDYNRIYTENLYSIGLVIGRYGLALAKRFRNIPDGAPVFLYQWTWDNVQAEQVWVPVGERIAEVMPGVVPQYDGEGQP
jgi:peptide/nickel transport system substrate-binding protein